MKKLISLLLALMLVFSLAACGGKDEGNKDNENENQTETNAPEYKLGMGVSLNTDSSETGHAQVDATVAAVVLDSEGKIVACRLDCAQSKMDIVDGAVDTEAIFMTKRELKEDYNMVKFSDATLEWYEQAVNFEAYAEGKTVEEVKNTATTTNDHGYNVFADEELHATCSIDITAFIDAIVKAGEDAKGVTFNTEAQFKLGLAAITKSDESTPATAEENAAVKMYTEYGATVVDDKGVILAAVTDATQPVVSFDMSGELVEATYKGTKRELGKDYGMVDYGQAIAEWDSQAQAFADYTVGKTADQVRAIETKTNDHGYNVPADETLLASCTMQITGMMDVLALSAEYAR